MTQIRDNDHASALALVALMHILSDEALRSRFLALSGVDADALRAGLPDPGFLASVLDFLLSHEPDLLEFCAAHDLEPGAPAAAHRVLEQM